MKFAREMRRLGASRLAARCTAVCLAAMAVESSTAATFQWTGAASSDWTSGANWLGGVAPASDLLNDTAWFNQASYGNQPSAATASVYGIQVGDGTTSTGVMSLAGTQLTLGGGGISVLGGAGAVTVTSPVTLGAPQTWSNASSSTLAMNGAITRGMGKTLSLVNSGAGSITSGTLSNNATGIVGAWATYGTGNATRYASMNGAAVEGFTGGTGLSAATINTTMTSAATNYDYSGGNAAISSSLAANTLRNASGGAVTLTLGTANPTVTLNGMLNAGVAAYSISNGTGANGVVVIGSSNELVLNAASHNIGINVPIWNSGSTGGVGGTAGSVTVTGPNKVTFGQNTINLFSGAITVNSGTLAISYNQSNPNVTSFTVNGGTVDLSSNGLAAAMGSGPLTINGGTFIKTGGSGTTYTVASQAWNGDIAVQGGNKLAFSGAVTLGKSITINVANSGGFTVPGAISDGGNGYGITKTGANVLFLNGSGSTFTGPVNIVEGELQLAAASDNSPIFNSSHVVYVNSGAVLGVASTRTGSTDTVGGLNDGLDGGGTVRLASTSARPVVLAGSGVYSFSGTLANSTTGTALSVNKTGSGTQVLSGASTYTGATTITGGLLRVDGSLGTTAVAVNAGGSLGGSGSLAGRVTVAGGSSTRGSLDLRDGAVGTLALDGNLTTTGAAGNFVNLFFDLGAVPGSSDCLAIAGTPTIAAGGARINLAALGSVMPGDYTLITATGGLGTLSLASDTLVVGSTTYDLTLAKSSATEVIVSISAIPEPVAMGLFAGLLPLMWGRRRR